MYTKEITDKIWLNAGRGMMDLLNVFTAVMDNIQDGVYIVSTDREIVYWNKSAERLTGYSSQEVLGRRCQDNLLKHIDKKGSPLCTVGCPLFSTLIDGKKRVARIYLCHKEGYHIPVEVKMLPLYDSSKKIVGAAEVFSVNQNVPYRPEVSFETELVDALAEEVARDELTGLYNRKFVSSGIKYKLKKFVSFGDSFCVVFFDIDDFAHFNNAYGHATGDAILRRLAQEIKEEFRATDIVGRWGGDEFIGLFDVATEDDLMAVAHKIQAVVGRAKVAIEDNQLSVNISVGITMARHEDTLESILERADELMYRAKQNNKNCVAVEEKILFSLTRDNVKD